MPNKTIIIPATEVIERKGRIVKLTLTPGCDEDHGITTGVRVDARCGKSRIVGEVVDRWAWRGGVTIVIDEGQPAVDGAIISDAANGQRRFFIDTPDFNAAVAKEGAAVEFHTPGGQRIAAVITELQDFPAGAIAVVDAQENFEAADGKLETRTITPAPRDAKCRTADRTAFAVHARGEA